MIKQVIVIRKKFTRPDGSTFALGRGKEIAQACHASLSFLLAKMYDKFDGPPWKGDSGKMRIDLTMNELAWCDSYRTGMAKVTLQVETEQELRDLHQKAKDEGLESQLIIDSGK